MKKKYKSQRDMTMAAVKNCLGRAAEKTEYWNNLLRRTKK